MDGLGKALRPAQRERMAENPTRIEKAMRVVEAEEEEERIRNVGIPAEAAHRRGELTVWERIDCLLDPGTFCPLH